MGEPPFEQGRFRRRHAKAKEAQRLDPKNSHRDGLAGEPWKPSWPHADGGGPLQGRHGSLEGQEAVSGMDPGFVAMMPLPAGPLDAERGRFPGVRCLFRTHRGGLSEKGRGWPIMRSPARCATTLPRARIGCASVKETTPKFMAPRTGMLMTGDVRSAPGRRRNHSGARAAHEARWPASDPLTIPEIISPSLARAQAESAISRAPRR